MTKTSKCPQKLAHKLICIWVLLSSTHQVAQAEASNKSTKTKNSSSKSCKAKKNGRSATLAVNLKDAVLLECEGDCAGKDGNCEEGLNCLKRTKESGKKVPGCKGKAIGVEDYCYARPCDDYLWIFNDGGLTDKDLLGECEGDCQYKDENCDEGLNCLQRTKDSDKTVPGCTGEASRGKDYCYARPSADNHLWIVKKRNVLPEANSLGECEGDCENKDENCEEGLECFERNNVEDTVPGCVGIASGRKDYCYDPMMVQ